MKNRFVRVSVVTIIVSLFYFIIFTEKVTDISSDKDRVIENNQDLFVEPDTIFNEGGYIVIAKPNVIKLIKRKDSMNNNYGNFFRLKEYKDDILLIKNINSGYIEILKEYKPEKVFEDYKVDVYSGKLAKPDFKSNPEAKMFVTRITEGCNEGINFAGHYTLIYWGCGSACQYGVVVDRKTGKIYDSYSTSQGSTFRADSKLILKNSGLMDDETNYVLISHSIKFKPEIWENNKFVAID